MLAFGVLATSQSLEMGRKANRTPRLARRRDTAAVWPKRFAAGTRRDTRPRGGPRGVGQSSELLAGRRYFPAKWESRGPGEPPLRKGQFLSPGRIFSSSSFAIRRVAWLLHQQRQQHRQWQITWRSWRCCKNSRENGCFAPSSSKAAKFQPLGGVGIGNGLLGCELP